MTLLKYDNTALESELSWLKSEVVLPQSRSIEQLESTITGLQQENTWMLLGLWGLGALLVVTIIFVIALLTGKRARKLGEQSVSKPGQGQVRAGNTEHRPATNKKILQRAFENLPAA